MKQIVFYKHIDGKEPVNVWLNSFDTTISKRIDARLARIEEGNMGDCKKLKDSELSEIRFDFGKGYRIYYYEFENILLLLGGDKSTQSKDIKKAEEYLKIWKEQQND